MRDETQILSSVYTNRHTGAKILMAPAGRLNGEQAWIVGDSRLSAYAKENYRLGQNRGTRLGIVVGVAISAIVCTVGVIRGLIDFKKDREKEEKKEKGE